MTVFGGVYTVIGYRLTEAPFSLPQGIVGLISRRRTIPPAQKGSDVEEGKIDQSDVPAAAR